MSTTYMNLTLPTVGTTIGPTWATALNSALTLVDSHNHSTGSGALITPSGLNINADLTFNSKNATALRSSRFSSQASSLVLATDRNCLSVVNGELYYNDGAGSTPFALTANGAVAGLPGSINGLAGSTASVGYISLSTAFVFLSASLTPALIDSGSIILRNLSASSYGMTVSAHAALAASFTVTFPAAAPNAQKIMTMNVGGAIEADYVLDNSSLEVSANSIRVKASGVTNAMLAGSIDSSAKILAGSITNSQLAMFAVGGANIANGAIGDGKMSFATLTGASMAANLSFTGKPYSDNKFIMASQTNEAGALGVVVGYGNGGTKYAGNGCTVAYTGNIVFTFTQAFAATPFIVFSSGDTIALPGDVYISAKSTTGFTLAHPPASLAGYGWSIIAMGVRS